MGEPITCKHFFFFGKHLLLAHSFFLSSYCWHFSEALPEETKPQILLLCYRETRLSKEFLKSNVYLKQNLLNIIYFTIFLLIFNIDLIYIKSICIKLIKMI